MTNGEPRIEPDSYRGGAEQVRDPRDDMRERPPEPDPEHRFYANGVGSVTSTLREASESTTGHNFEEAIELVEDALEDLEKLQDGPDDSTE